ncbi:MAG: hypothetical protein ACTSQZ_02810 [Candidatus Thorarchaeota archaeon]
MKSEGSLYHLTEEIDIFYQVKKKTVIDKDGSIEIIKLEKPLKVKANPLQITDRLYSATLPDHYVESIYPASSHEWYGRMLHGTINCTYIIQEVEDNSQYWLIILDSIEGIVFQRHPIRLFEIMPLKIQTSLEHNIERIKELGPENPAEVRCRLLEHSDRTTISWQQIATLTAKAPMPCLKRGNSTRESLEYILPAEFPKNVRDELIFFLAWTLKKSIIPTTDSFDFNNELLPLLIARQLMIGHLRFILDKTTYPSYYKSMIMAVQWDFEQSRPVMEESSGFHKHVAFVTNSIELFPDWRGEVIKYARLLTESGKVDTCFPITKTEAKQSREAWRARLGMLNLELKLRAHIRTSALGLNRILYFGSGYRWNHPHLAYTIRLRDPNKQSIYFHNMIMPPPSIEIANRIFKDDLKITAEGILVRGKVNISWAGRAVNLSLFNEDENEWILPLKRILRSVKKSSTKRKLENRFGKWRGARPYFPSQLETRVMDMAVPGIRLTNLEHAKGEKAYGVTSTQANAILTKLRNLDILDIAYEIRHARLVPLVSVIQGDPKQVCAVSHSFMESTLSSTVFLGHDSNISVILSTVPFNDREILLQELPDAGKSAGLRIQCLIPEAFRNYTTTLYQRLRLADGEWDSDLSALQAQASSVPSKSDDHSREFD